MANPTLTLPLFTVNNLPANNQQKYRADRRTQNTKDNVHIRR